MPVLIDIMTPGGPLTISGEDRTDMNSIRKMTADCPREDCALQPGISTQTLMGWTPSYDKHGRRTDRGDPNIISTHWRCTACGREWIESTQRGAITIHISKKAD
jgi:hypothetical protein